MSFITSQKYKNAKRSLSLLKKVGGVGGGVIPTCVYAEDKVSQTLGSNTQMVQPSDYFFQILLSLILVLVIIFVAAFLLRRYAHVTGTVNGQLKVIGGLSLGQREKIVLVKVGEDQLLLGVTSSKISHLHTLKTPIEVDSKQNHSVVETEGLEKRVPFSQKFREAFNRKEVSSHSASSK